MTDMGTAILIIGFLILTNIVMVMVHVHTINLEYEERKRMAQERQKLLDRIQAKDLPEYKAFSEPPKPREPKKPDDIIVQV